MRRRCIMAQMTVTTCTRCPASYIQTHSSRSSIQRQILHQLVQTEIRTRLSNSGLHRGMRACSRFRGGSIARAFQTNPSTARLYSTRTARLCFCSTDTQPPVSGAGGAASPPPVPPSVLANHHCTPAVPHTSGLERPPTGTSPCYCVHHLAAPKKCRLCSASRNRWAQIASAAAAALSWLRRRGPGLQEGVMHRLFRKRQVPN